MTAVFAGWGSGGHEGPNVFRSAPPAAGIPAGTADKVLNWTGPIDDREDMNGSWHVVVVVAVAPFLVTTLAWTGFTMATRLRTRRQLLRAFRSVISARRRLARHLVAVPAGWMAVTTVLTPVSPALAVWAGGVVVALGASLVATTRPALDFDAAELDLELRALLDEHA